MSPASLSRPASVAALGAVYAFVAALSIVIGYWLPLSSPLLTAGVVDLVATLLIFGFSVLFNNSSVYDPYWSVAPVVMVAYWSSVAAISVRSLLVLVLVALWGGRLTFNFVRHWRGMSHEDWRYAAYRDRARGFYWLVSLLGFHLVPTAVVFAACVPVYRAVSAAPALTPLDFVAATLTGAAILIEAAADHQMRSFRRSAGSCETTFRGGLWAYSRHPNYFGEILFWWGLYLFAVAADPSSWWTVFGALAVTGLFVAVSLPLMEARMSARRPDYEHVCRETPMLIPRVPRPRGGMS